MSEHNTENPVSFEEAMKELKVSSFVLSALRSQLGIRGRRPFMLSPIRDFLRDNPNWTTRDVYRLGKRKASVGIEQRDGVWFVSINGVTMDGRNLEKTLASVAPIVKEAITAPSDKPASH